MSNLPSRPYSMDSSTNLENDLKNKTIKVLIVDDAEDDRFLYHRFLKNNRDYKFECLEADTWQSGLELWISEMPDIVLLDYNLPDGNGLQFLERANNLNNFKFVTLPIIILTGQGNDQIAVQAIQLGAVDYLVKGEINKYSLPLKISQALERISLQRQLWRSQQQETIIGNIALRVRQYLSLDWVLESIVTEVKSFLQADRVIIYQFQPDFNGVIVAEAVSPPWTSCVNLQIVDTCFQSNQGGAYREGKVFVARDVYQANLTPCHLELLARFEVKANLVVPILLVEETDRPLWGLLIAHQCSSPRDWETTEITLLQRLAVQLAIALQQAELYNALEEGNSILEQKVIERTLELQNSEQRYRSLVAACPVGIYRVDAEDKYVYVNEYANAITGYTPVLGSKNTCYQALHPDDVESVLRELARCKAEKCLFSQEYRFLHPDGKVVWVYGRILPEYNHQGEYIGYVGTLTDITDRKEAELELQRNQESLRKAELFNRLAVEASGIGIWELDLTTNDSYISPKMAELMDYSPQERTIPQEKWLNSIIPADREMVKDTIATCKLTGSFFNLEFRILLKNGKQRWLYSRGGLTYDPAGQPQIISGCTLDITDRKALEQEKQEAQQQLEDLNEELETKIEERTLELSKINSFQQAILNSTSYAIIATDVHGIIQTFNKGAELISGYTALEMIGKHTPEVLHDPIEIINQYQELCRELGEDITLGFEVFVAKARRNLVTEDEWTYIRKDGSRFPILLSVTALRNKEQEIIGFVGIAKDITQTKRIEQERAKLAQRLEIALNSAAIGSWDWDLQSNEVTWDERMFQLYGRTPTPDYKVPYQEWRNWAEPNSLALAESQLSETLLQGTPFEIELCIYHPDRSIHYLQVYAIVIRDHANQPIRIIGVNYDITKRKQAERELQESEARWQFALEGAGDGIWDLNVQTRTVFYSSKWKTMLGYEDHEIEGNVSAWINLLHPDDRERCLNHAEQYLQGNIPTYELEHRLRCKDGHYKWILSRGKLIEWTAEGQPLRLVGTHTDLTVIRQAEAENRLLKDRLEFLVGSSPAIIYSCKTEYDFATTFISKNVKNVLGYDPEHFLDESDFWIRHIHPEDQVRTPDEIGLLFAQGCHQYEYRFVHQEGHYVWVRDEMELIRDADGEPLDIVGYVADITAIKQAEVQLRRTNEELMRATRLKDEFLANMSHELRTPLNSILGLTEALAEGLLGHLNEKQRQSLETVANSANHLLALINDILDVAKIESGQVVLDCQPVAVAPLCQSSLAFVKQLALTKRVQLSLNLPLSLPPLMVDERRIRQVLINLLNNAVKFTPEGGRVTLEVSQLSPQERPGSQGYAPDPQEQYSYLRLAVIDTGIGIAPEDAQKLFKPFVQIDSALNREYQGTGLGLALVKNIVELHGGKVSLSSQPGQGSRFMIDLPAAAIVSTIPMNSNIPVSTSEYLVEEEETTSAPLILLVEDNQANVLTVTNYLTAKGYRLLFAQNGEEAINILKSEQPELILMDIQMPKMDGLEATQYIRNQLKLTDIPIIALTALAMPGDRERCLEAGANEYLSKPVKLKLLVETMQQFLNSSPEN